MKTLRSFSKNRLFSAVRFASAGALLCAAAVMAFVASGDRLVTLGSPSSQLSHDRAVKGKIAGDRDTVPLRSARTTPGEGPIGGYEAYKSATRTYPANVIPPSMVQNAKNTFNMIAAQGDPQGNNHWQPYGALQNAIEPGVLAFTGKTDTTATRSPVLVIAPTCVPGNCRLWVGAAAGALSPTPTPLARDPTPPHLPPR